VTGSLARLVFPALRWRRGSFAHERPKIDAALTAGRTFTDPASAFTWRVRTIAAAMMPGEGAKVTGSSALIRH